MTGFVKQVAGVREFRRIDDEFAAFDQDAGKKGRVGQRAFVNGETDGAEKGDDAFEVHGKRSAPNGAAALSSII